MGILTRLASAYISAVRRPFEEVCVRTAKCMWNSYAASFILYATVLSSTVASSACIILCRLKGALFLLMIPAPILAAYMYRQASLDSHRRGLEKEEPYFLVYSLSMHSSGMPLHIALESLDEGTLPAHSREAARYKRIARVIQDPYEALARLADTSLSRGFSRLLRSYIGALRSGTGLESFFEVRVEEAIRRIRDSWTRFADIAGEAGEALSLINVLGVFMVLLYGVISGYTMAMIMGTMLLIPLLSGFIYLYVDQQSPGMEGWVKVPVWVKLSYIAALILGLASYIVFREPWTTLILASTPMIIVGAVFEATTLSRIRGMEAALPAIIRGVSDYTRLGYPLSKSLARIAEEEEDAWIKRTLNILKNIIDSGETLPRSTLENLPGHARYVFKMLHSLSKTMLTPPKALEALASFIGEAIYAKAKVASRLHMHEIILYAFAPMVLYALKALVNASKGLTAGVSGSLGLTAPEMTLEPSVILLVLLPSLLSHGAVVEKLVTGVGWQPLRKGIALLTLGVSGLILMG